MAYIGEFLSRRIQIDKRVGENFPNTNRHIPSWAEDAIEEIDEKNRNRNKTQTQSLCRLYRWEYDEQDIYYDNGNRKKYKPARNAFCTMCCLAEFLSRCSHHTRTCINMFLFFVLFWFYRSPVPRVCAYASFSFSLSFCRKREWGAEGMRQLYHLVYGLSVLVFLYSVHLPFLSLSPLIYFDVAFFSHLCCKKCEQKNDRMSLFTAVAEFGAKIYLYAFPINIPIVLWFFGIH